MARVAPRQLEAHGEVRIDEYYWLRERESPAVIDYLEAENEYTRAVMAGTEELQQQLYDEILARIQEDDRSVPYRLRGFYYYDREEEGEGYPIYCRRRGSMEADEEVMLDVNRLAEGQDFTAVSGLRVSPENDLLAYAVDHLGRRKYELRFRDLDSGEELADRIPEVTGNVVWAADNRTVFYGKQDPETLRSYQIFRHRLGSDPADDRLVFEEGDETFSAYVSQSKSREYLFIVSSHTLRTEVRYLRADDPEGRFRVFEPRGGEHEYRVDHYGDRFFIRTNLSGKNFHLMSTPLASTAKEAWQEVVARRDDVFFSGFELFEDYLVLAERRGGLMRLRVRPWDGAAEHEIEFDEPTYAARLSRNPELDTELLRFTYSSLTVPPSTYDYHLRSREKTLLKREPVLGEFSSGDYQAERLEAVARDGTRVPISLVYRKGFERDGASPLLLYAYGSYGSSIDASFSISRLSLLDRGFVYAIAHVRGGQELGYRWYEGGKLLNKKNTFYDFIDVAEHLVAERYTSADRLFARGGSAGGLLMGAITNLRPELFRGVIAGVPFVDVITTMLDATIPLTSFEWDEWGDPRDKEAYDYMLSYSPYDNVEAKEYPNLLVTAGLYDSQVQYWEPAKWVARLRALATGDNLLLLRTNMEAGHGGASGRYRRLEETAFELAFLLSLVPE